MMRLPYRLIDAIGFLAYFLWELILANLRMARDVVRPLDQLRPAIVAIPLDLDNDWQITVLSNVITLTPGTMSLDVSSDRKMLYIHVMHVTDIAGLRAQIKTGFEKRVRRLMS